MGNVNFAYVGHYIKGKRTKTVQVVNSFCCENDSAHFDEFANNNTTLGGISTKHNYCSVCGGRICPVPHNVVIDRSFVDLQRNQPYQWIQSIEQTDLDWIRNNEFMVADPCALSEDGYDYVFVTPYIIEVAPSAIEIDTDWVMDSIKSPPIAEDAEHLQRIMKYSTVELCFGLLLM